MEVRHALTCFLAAHMCPSTRSGLGRWPAHEVVGVDCAWPCMHSRNGHAVLFGLVLVPQRSCCAESGPAGHANPTLRCAACMLQVAKATLCSIGLGAHWQTPRCAVLGRARRCLLRTPRCSSVRSFSSWLPGAGPCASSYCSDSSGMTPSHTPPPQQRACTPFPQPVSL